MKRILPLLVLPLSILLASCNSSGPSAAVADYCKCAGPLHAKAEEMISAMQKGDMSVMQTMTQEMEGMSGDMEACMNKLMSKYEDKKNDKEFQQAVVTGIEKKCPNPASKMAGAMMKMGR